MSSKSNLHINTPNAGPQPNPSGCAQQHRDPKKVHKKKS